MASRKEEKRDPRESWEDAQLVEACRDGDQAAWNVMVRRYRRLIYSIPMRYGASSADAADIFQAVCLELFAELPRLRKVESLRSWLISVASHQAFHWKQRYLRRTAREAEPTELDSAAAAEPVAPEILETAEREQILREAITSLPPRCREMIRLLFYEHPPLAYAEVARRLGLATGSIGFIRGRCLQKLQHALRESGFEE